MEPPTALPIRMTGQRRWRSMWEGNRGSGRN